MLFLFDLNFFFYKAVLNRRAETGRRFRTSPKLSVLNRFSPKQPRFRNYIFGLQLETDQYYAGYAEVVYIVVSFSSVYCSIFVQEEDAR